MKIIIDIDEEVLNKLPEAELGSNVIEDILEAVENGTPLPEGHGRLIDADELCNALLTKWETADKEKEVMICAIMADIVTPIVVGQETIIEADRKGASE